MGGSLLFAGAQWAILIAIAKLGSPRLAGDWTLGLAITAPIFIFWQLKLRSVQATDVRGENAWGDFAALRILGTALACVAVLGVVIAAYRDHTAYIIMAIALTRVFDGGSDLAYGQLQKAERMDRIALSMAGRGLSSLAIGIAVLLLTHSAAWIALGTAAAYSGWLLWDLEQVRSTTRGSLRPVWHRPVLGTLFRRALPLGFVTAIGALQISIPRYFLEGYASREELGIFATLASVLLLGSLVVSAIAQTSVPRLSRLAAAGQWRAFRSLLLRMMGVGFLLGVLAIAVSALFGRELLALVLSQSYEAHADVLLWLAITSGLTWTYVFLGTALDAMRRYSLQPWIHGTSTGVIALASAILVPQYGMLGATWSMLIGYLCEFVMYLIAVAIPLARQRDSGVV